ncbi:MAG: SUMO-activating enzyme 1B [Monoraphidium minutum]|nr:MAG: SUMO-activating enzyme 1B [Monoraphidium minutum]
MAVEAGADGAAAAAVAVAALTHDEATVYDRQLRVWGVEVQKKLTAARVLIAGFGKLAAEVAKNITLAGVGSVTLLDDAPASDHEGSSFLITSPAPEGLSCAEAAAKTLQAMNPLVRVSSAPGAPEARLLDAPFLAAFDLVVCTGPAVSPAATRAAGAACAAAGVKFMAAAVRGAASYYFIDLGAHTYKPKADAGGEGGGGSGLEEVTVSYARLGDALATPLGLLPPNCHPLVPVLIACAALEDELGRALAPADAPAAAAKLQQLSAAAAPWAGPAAERLLSWVAAGGSEFAPVAAVTGGVIGNDVIRAVSHSDAPINNLFLYTLSDRPLVQTLPPPGAAGGGGGGGAAAQWQAAAELIDD